MQVRIWIFGCDSRLFMQLNGKEIYDKTYEDDPLLSTSIEITDMLFPYPVKNVIEIIGWKNPGLNPDHNPWHFWYQIEMADRPGNLFILADTDVRSFTGSSGEREVFRGRHVIVLPAENVLPSVDPNNDSL